MGLVILFPTHRKARGQCGAVWQCIFTQGGYCQTFFDLPQGGMQQAFVQLGMSAAVHSMEPGLPTARAIFLNSGNGIVASLHFPLETAASGRGPVRSSVDDVVYEIDILMPRIHKHNLHESRAFLG